MSNGTNEEFNTNPEVGISKLDVPDILDIYKTRILNETKQEFFAWLKRYTFLFVLIAWLVSLVGVGYLVEKILENTLDEKVLDIQRKSNKFIEDTVEKTVILGLKIEDAKQLANELKEKLRKRKLEFDKTSHYIRATAQDSQGEFLRYERLISKIGLLLLRLSRNVDELSSVSNYSAINTDLNIFKLEVQSIFETFRHNGNIRIDLATRKDSSMAIPDNLAIWLTDRGFIVRRYSKAVESALQILYGENYKKIIKVSNFVMIKYSEGNEELMKEIVHKLKEDPYFEMSKYDISKSNGESIGSFVSVLF